ncbi:tRNA pseudouridine38-40 synthase [Leucobacter exalbidus]|uniref:tRNA pseudouridine synthase A n=1 Tax=Leucobacter exalbidus TaxID=662960 RepID=A0A940PTM6_9MICO|nr:tRNA pseudouridine(38-40) synthase TruA [Leucobacter exalbidus]MBP1327274.1 tRNA pseudouridine38-40 synthase [Leucobacter exalbidus]
MEDETHARLRLDLAYDGTDFAGWAKQPGLRTVEGVLETALETLLRTTSPRLTVAGRTDTGVHARGQVAHVDVTAAQFEKWGTDSRTRVRKLNGVLKMHGRDVVVHSIEEVPTSFDARFSALRRRYEYRLRGAEAHRDPLTARFTVDLGQSLDLAAIQHASDELLGLNDFTSFCKARERSTSVRELLCFEWSQTPEGVLVARIEADAFCHSMVRALVGAVVAVGSGRITDAELTALREARKRTSQFTVMPAHGLSLEEVAYPAHDELAARAELTRTRRDPGLLL